MIVTDKPIGSDSFPLMPSILQLPLGWADGNNFVCERSHRRQLQLLQIAVVLLGGFGDALVDRGELRVDGAEVDVGLLLGSADG